MDRMDKPDEPVTGWTPDTLHELVCVKVKALRDVMDERDRRYAENTESVSKALEVAEKVTEAWRASANEWRLAMSDRERKFMTKEIGMIFTILSIAALIITIYEFLHK